MDELNGYSCICSEGYRWEEHKSNVPRLYCGFSALLLKQPLTLVLFIVVSCVKFPHLHCPCVSWPIARTMPRVWSEEGVPCASVLLSLGGHAVRSLSASTLLTETPTYCSLTSRTGLKLTSHFRYSKRALMCAHAYDFCVGAALLKSGLLKRPIQTLCVFRCPQLRIMVSYCTMETMIILQWSSIKVMSRSAMTLGASQDMPSTGEMSCSLWKADIHYHCWLIPFEKMPSVILYRMSILWFLCQHWDHQRWPVPHSGAGNLWPDGEPVNWRGSPYHNGQLWGGAAPQQGGSAIRGG